MGKENFVKALLFIIGLAIYLNIGWIVGTYMHNNVIYSAELKGPVAVFLAGPSKVISNPTKPEIERDSLLDVQVFFSMLWPLLIMAIISSWIGHGIWYGIGYGIAKLFGAG